MQPSVSFIFKTLRDTKMFPRNETKHRCAFLNFLRVILRVDARWMVRSLRLSSSIWLTYKIEYDLFNENLIFLRIHLQILSEAIKELQVAGITSNRIDRCGHRRYRKLEKYRKKKKYTQHIADNSLRNVNVKLKMIRLNLFDVSLGQVNLYPQFYSFSFLLIFYFTNSLSNPLQINNFTF